MKKAQLSTRKLANETQIPIGNEWDWSYSFVNPIKESETKIDRGKKNKLQLEERAERCLTKLEIIQTRLKYPHNSFHVKTPRSEVYANPPQKKYHQVCFGSPTPIPTYKMGYVGTEKLKRSNQYTSYEQACQLSKTIKLDNLRKVPVKKAPTLDGYNPFKEEENIEP